MTGKKKTIKSREYETGAGCNRKRKKKEAQGRGSRDLLA